METKTVTHDRPGEPLSVTVGEANVLTGMRHTMLLSEARTFLVSDEDEEQPEAQEQADDAPASMPEGEQLVLYLLRRYTWPNCKAAVKASSGFDHATLTFEAFCQMPEQFVAKWERAVLDLNPHWELGYRTTDKEEAEEKKDDSASTSE